jgi:thioredoxin 1
MAGIAALTDKNFDETVQKGGIVIIDFWATWCAPCKKFAPVFEKVAKKHADVVFARVDVDADEQLADDFDIEGIPTVVAIRDGVVVGAEEGAMPAAVLEEFIAQVRALDMDDVRATLALEEEQEAEAAEAPKKAKKSAPAKKPAAKKPAARSRRRSRPRRSSQRRSQRRSSPRNP